MKQLMTAFAMIMFAGQVQAQTNSPQFRRLDVNKDGKLTKDEFTGPLFDRIDADKDGVVTADEDREFLRQRTARDRNAVNVDDTSVQAQRDLAYANTRNPRQTLDLYLPKKPTDSKPLPVIVFIHGGGWAKGDKRGGYRMLAPFVQSGQYAGVSIGYRLTDEAIWPAQLHDCKAAIRWLRANAEMYNLDPQSIGVTGTSAGGHLVAMLGVANDLPELEGTLGEHRNESSRVQCVADQFGPTDLLEMGGWHNQPDSPEAKLIGGPIQENQEKARDASPISHVSKDDPPFLFLHGTKNAVVPFDQSERLHAALEMAGVESTLHPVVGGGHGGLATPQVVKRLQQFFDKHLLPR